MPRLQHLLDLHVVGHVARVRHPALAVARPRKLRQAVEIAGEAELS